MHSTPRLSVMSYLVLPKQIHLMIPSVWHYSSRICAEAQLHVTSPPSRLVEQHLISRALKTNKLTFTMKSWTLEKVRCISKWGPCMEVAWVWFGKMVIVLFWLSRKLDMGHIWPKKSDLIPVLSCVLTCKHLTSVEIYLMRQNSVKVKFFELHWLNAVGDTLFWDAVFLTLGFLSLCPACRKTQGKDFKCGWRGSRQEKRYPSARGLHCGDCGGGRFGYGAVPWCWGGPEVLTHGHEYGKNFLHCTMARQRQI